MNLRIFFLCLAAMLLSATVLAADSAGPVTLQGPVDIAVGRGERGPWQQNESRYDYVDDPAVGIDDRGEVSVAWVDQGRKDVFFQRYSPGGKKRLGQPVNISRTPATFSWLPRLVVAPNVPEKIFVLWQEIIFSGGSHGGEIVFAGSDDGGKSFTKPVNLSNSVGGDGKGRINREIWHNGSLDLVADADGAIYAAWTEYAGTLWFRRSTDGGKSFFLPQRVAGSDGTPARAPSLALGPDRRLHLAWTVGEDSAADIHIATSTDGGASFSQPQIVARSPAYSDAPKLAVDGDGVLHLAYAESSAGPFDQYHIRYTRSVDGGHTFEPPQEISKPAPTSNTGAGFPAIDVDGKGRLYVIWELFPEHRELPRGLGLAVSRDGGRSFTQPGVVPGSADPEGYNGSSQGLLMKKLAVNRHGAVAIVNSSLKQDEKSRVWLILGKSAD